MMYLAYKLGVAQADETPETLGILRSLLEQSFRHGMALSMDDLQAMTAGELVVAREARETVLLEDQARLIKSLLSVVGDVLK